MLKPVAPAARHPSYFRGIDTLTHREHDDGRPLHVIIAISARPLPEERGVRLRHARCSALHTDFGQRRVKLGSSPEPPVPDDDADSARANPLNRSDPQRPRLDDQVIHPPVVISVDDMPLPARIAHHAHAALVVHSK